MFSFLGFGLWVSQFVLGDGVMKIKGPEWEKKKEVYYSFGRFIISFGNVLKIKFIITQYAIPACSTEILSSWNVPVHVYTNNVVDGEWSRKAFAIGKIFIFISVIILRVMFKIRT